VAVGPQIPITVLDDASPTDEVKEAAARFSGRIDYHRNDTNLGLAANFFKSFKISQGRFTLVLGSDDQMLPGYEDALISALRKFPQATVVHPNVEVIDSIGNPFFPMIDRIKHTIRGKIQDTIIMENQLLRSKLLIGDFMYFPAITWRTEELLNQIWDTRYKQAVDLDLLLKLTQSDANFVFVPEKVFQYRRHTDSISSKLEQDGTRLNEELSVHWHAREQMLRIKRFRGQRVLAQIAPTIRIHALIIGLKQIPKNPYKGLRKITKALAPIKPIS
jgi:glycosyltransferase involved in cell wall biosynthesis